MSSSIYFINSYFNLGDNTMEHYYFWAACCFCNVLAIFNRLTQFKLINEVTSVIVLAIKLNYPFLYVIVLNYFVCANIGGYLFGGNINSTTPDRMAEVGQATKDEYKFANWNDFLSSLVYLYSIQLNNNINMYINYCTVNEGPHRSFKPMFFFFFYMLNNVILNRIFVGQVIEISLAYFREIDKESKRFTVYESTPSIEKFYFGDQEDDKKVVRVKV